MGDVPRPDHPDPRDDPRGAALDDPDDAARLARYATELADAIERALPGWVEHCVRGVLEAQGIAPDATIAERTAAAARQAVEDGVPRVRALLAADIDDQRGNPLAVVRSLVRHPTGVLRAAGARPVPRDGFAERSFPDDVYDLSPAAFADVDPALHEPGLVWGAAKAHVHLSRRRRSGQL
jgi:hypothetical protein